MAFYNRVILMGNLTADPELRYTKDGTPVCSFRMAVNEVYTTPSGEKKENTVFVPITIWRKQAETCAEYLKKGRSVLVEGRLKMSNWTTSDGQKRSRLEITAGNVRFLGAPPSAKTEPVKEPAAEPPEETEENIPF